MPHPSRCQLLMYLARALWYKYILMMLSLMPTVPFPRVGASSVSVEEGTLSQGTERSGSSPRVPDVTSVPKRAEAATTTKSPSENLSLISPICSGAASPHCLPGCLPQTLSSTLFSISCNHLLEIYFSFKMSPGNQNRHLRSLFRMECECPHDFRISVTHLASRCPWLHDSAT